MFEDLLAFAVVVEQASLNQASRVLNLSQPALSRKIRNLENQLGIPLFERKGKRLELTGPGQTAYEHVLALRRWESKFRDALELTHGRPRDPITIGASLTTLQSTLPDLISLFSRILPELEIKAITGKTHEIVGYVKQRKVDLGLVASKIDESGLACIPLFDDHLSLVLPKNHPLAAAPSIGIQALSGLPMILFSKGTWYRILMDEWFQRYAIFPEIRMEIDSFEAIIRLIPTCGVAALLPRSYLRSGWLADGGLVVAELPELEQTTRTTSIIFTEWPRLPGEVNRVIDAAKALYSDGVPIR